MQHSIDGTRLWEVEGVVVLKAALISNLPKELHPKIEGYYTALWQALTNEAEARLLGSIASSYARDTNPRKRYTTRPHRITMTLEGAFDGACLCVKRTLCYAGGGKQSTTLHGEVFCTQTGRLLPLSHFHVKRPRRGALGRTGRRAFRAQEYLLRGGAPYLVTEAGEIPLATAKSERS